MYIISVIALMLVLPLTSSAVQILGGMLIALLFMLLILLAGGPELSVRRNTIHLST